MSGRDFGENGARILLVEDSPDDAEILEWILRKHGLLGAMTRVDTEGPFRRALQTERPDLVLCDYHLPDFDPYRAVTILREMDDGVPLIVVSHGVTEGQARELIEYGARECVRKADFVGLETAVRRALCRCKDDVNC